MIYNTVLPGHETNVAQSLIAKAQVTKIDAGLRLKCGLTKSVTFLATLVG